MPVLLKGEMMKKLLTYCSLLGIALSGYQPAFAAMDIDGYQVGVPQKGGKDVPTQLRVPFLVEAEKTLEGKKIVYKWNLKNTLGDYCDPYETSNRFYWEIKFYPNVGQEYLAHYFKTADLKANGMSIRGDKAYQRVPVNIGDSVEFQLTLTLKDEALYQSDTDYIVRAGQKLSLMTIFCTSGSIVDGSFKDKEILYNKFTGFSLVSQNDATLHLSRTCIIAGNRDFEVNLSPVTKAELENKGRIKGGQFDLLLSCSQAEIKNAYIMFTDQLDPGNKTTFLTTQNGSTKREDVKFIIQDSEGKAVQYGPAPTSSIVLQGEQVDYPNMQLFGKRLSNEPFLKKSYTVYYQKTTPTTVEPGEVKGKVIYNFYYN
ncbi:fimbrial protein [Gallibacterium anatis]|uniref:fimbrial protein n=1 Tax=Gallibacterium anatis TaxID=750 RepID=UPI00254C61BA|nr:fimbrial protein [Gallibacterium anatis]WIM82126.1 fimbrial protein [Gallibacterium anatis]